MHFILITVQTLTLLHLSMIYDICSACVQEGDTLCLNERLHRLKIV